MGYATYPTYSLVLQVKKCKIILYSQKMKKSATKLLKMSGADLEALERITLAAQVEYRKSFPDALGSELPSANHVLRALIRFADSEISSDTELGSTFSIFCAVSGDLWD